MVAVSRMAPSPRPEHKSVAVNDGIERVASHHIRGEDIPQYEEHLVCANSGSGASYLADLAYYLPLFFNAPVLGVCTDTVITFATPAKQFAQASE